MPQLSASGYFVINWLSPSKKRTRLAHDSLHIWSLELDHTVKGLKDILSSDEQQRLEGMKTPQAQHRFLQARATLRIILSHYLQQPADSIVFDYGELGKPVLANLETPLQFNLSHCAGHGLLAIREKHTVGVDIEAIKMQPSAIRIARRVLGNEVLKQLEELEEPHRSQVFIEQWTKMEAAAKAIGGGVFSGADSSHNLNTVSWIPYADWCASVASDGPIPNLVDWSFFLATPLVKDSINQ